VGIDFDYELLRACENGYLDVVKYCIENGADVHVEDDHALIWSAYRGNLEVVKCLVEYGADIHANNEASLRYSYRYIGSGAVKFLVQKGANITFSMDIPEDVQEIAIQNDVSNIRNIINLRSDLKEKYKHLLTADSFGIFEDE
jgi:hypothetical protein